ncbi:nitrilase, partial [Thioclava sp. BHET1]
ALARLARETGCGLTIGYAEQAEGRRYNAALALGPDGECLASYRKIQPFGPREKALFTPGDDLVTFAFKGWRCGLLICYDVEFAPLCKAMADAGTELLLVPTANPDPFDHVCRLTVPSQAVNHGLTIAYANYCGPEEGITYCGGSVIVGPDGVPLATAGLGEALLITDLAPVRAIPQDRLSTQATDLRWRV